MGNVELVAIINSFNRLALISKALPALCEALSDCPFSASVVVFDAGSTDGSKSWLEQYCPSASIPIHVIQACPGADSSFSAGVNAACAEAIKLFPQCSFFFLYETDNWLASSAPLVLARQLLQQRAELAAVGFTVCRHSGAPAGFGTDFPTVLQFLVGQQLTLFLGLGSPRLRTAGNINGIEWGICDIVFTSPLLVRRTAWEESGGMDSSTFPFSDCDADWSWRLSKLGWQIAVLKLKGVVHDNGGELSTWSLRRVVDYHRARLKLLARHVGAWVHWLKPLLLIRHVLEFMVLILLPRSPEEYRLSLRKRSLLIKTVMSNYEGSQ